MAIAIIVRRDLWGDRVNNLIRKGDRYYCDLWRDRFHKRFMNGTAICYKTPCLLLLQLFVLY